jgi:hypothetical protein
VVVVFRFGKRRSTSSTLGAYEGCLKYNVVDGEPPGLAVDNSAQAIQGRVYVTSGNTELASVYAYPPGAATGAASLSPIGMGLRREGIRIFFEGWIDSSHGGLRGSFEGLPVAPVTKFTMTLFGGRKRGLLVVADNLCRRPQVATARLLGQSNLGQETKPGLGMRCGRRR